jgi:hypothetical protein
VTPPRIAVVDGFSVANALVTELRNGGAQCLHILSSPSIPDFFTRSFQPENFDRDLGYVADIDALVDELVRWKADRVVPGTESGVLLADLLSTRLNTPGNLPANSAARRNKALMGEVVAAAGLATPRGRAFASAQDAVRWYLHTELREAVVKPLDSAGTDNVWFCEDSESVELASRSVLTGSNVYGAPNRKVLVQERIRGVEYFINSVSDKGIHRVVEIGQYTKRPGPTGTPIYDFEEFVPASSAEGAILREFTVAVLDALGITSSASHTEVMLAERGPVLIETGARLGGAVIPQVVKRYAGVSQAHVYAATLLDPDFLVKFDEQAMHWSATIRFVYLINWAAGVTAPLDWVTRLEAIPSVVATMPTLKPGTWLGPTSKLSESPGFVYLAAQDQAEIERDYELIRKLEQEGLYTAVPSPV